MIIPQLIFDLLHTHSAGHLAAPKRKARENPRHHSYAHLAGWLVPLAREIAVSHKEPACSASNPQAKSEIALVLALAKIPVLSPARAINTSPDFPTPRAYLLHSYLGCTVGVRHLICRAQL